MSKSTLTRRALVASTAVMPAAAALGLPLAALADPTGSDADQRLFEIEAKVLNLKEAEEPVVEAMAHADEAMTEWGIRNPKPIGERCDPLSEEQYAELRAQMQAGSQDENQLAIIARGIDEVGSETMTELIKLVQQGDDQKAAAFAIALREWNARHRIALQNCGYDQKAAAWDALFDEIVALCNEASGIQATSLAGLGVKARLIRLTEDDFSVPPHDLAESIVRDLCSTGSPQDIHEAMALPSTPSVSFPTGTQGAELLRLGAALNRLEQEWAVQHAIDAKRLAAWEGACEAAGLPRIGFGSVPDDEFRAHQDKRSNIWTELHGKDDDDENEDGSSVWDKFHDRLYPLVDEILRLKASTPAGLAVQARAVVMAAQDLWDCADHHDGNQHERLFIEAACAFCGIAPLPMQRRQARALARVS